jgi:hypothetical protein
MSGFRVCGKPLDLDPNHSNELSNTQNTAPIGVTMENPISHLLRVAMPHRHDADDTTTSERASRDANNDVLSSRSNERAGAATRITVAPKRVSSARSPTRYGVRATTHATIAGDSVLTSVGEYRKQRGELESTPVKSAPVNQRGRN